MGRRKAAKKLVRRIDPVKGSENEVIVSFKGGRKFRVMHVDDYGVLVVGTVKVLLARTVLYAVGYRPALVGSCGYMPTMVDQTEGAWPRGHKFGGKPAVAFYFPGSFPG